MSGSPLPKIAFVLPWYGESIVGGAETEARKLAENLHQRGYAVEILTTCAKDAPSGWLKDFHKERASLEGGVIVRRFRLDRLQPNHFGEINARLMKGKSVSQEEEILFITEIVNSSRLYSFIEKNRESYIFVFTPYLFGTTYWGSKRAPERSYLIPCLHDEGYARMRIFQDMFQNCRGMLCYSEPEMSLAKRLFPLADSKMTLLGGGIDTTVQGNPEAFRQVFGINDPFVLYVGRRSDGKNTPLLIDFFCRFKSRNEGKLKLVLAGSGEVSIPGPYRDDVVDLGFLSEQGKADAYAAALVTCQPSVNESFSIVIMESWVQNIPVLVHAKCAVTKDHCEKSNGGLYFNDYWEFEGCLEFLTQNPSVRERMGQLGAEYVNTNCSWERVTERFVSTVFKD